ncbi:MAG: zinc ribbon domain-containing protein [Candidatus Hydrogenedentes bacterium]|nr:zinc ribbon domain-containing protein [Candidatus Hydrogenedentota bacterium]
MPTYEYECRKCGHVFEKFHSMSEKPRVRCPKCKGPSKKLLGTGAGIIFKGSGFYETDYKRKNGGASAACGSKPDSNSKSSDKTSATTSDKTSDSGKKSTD